MKEENSIEITSGILIGSSSSQSKAWLVLYPMLSMTKIQKLRLIWTLTILGYE